MIPFDFLYNKNWTKNHFLTVKVVLLLSSLNSNYYLHEKSMSDTNFNYCPNCGKKIQKSNSKKVNFCCYCGRELKNKRVNSHDKIQCTVCHEFIWHGRSRTIKCSFCGSQYHYSCVSSWIMKYNSCPMCQNVFLNPTLTYSKKRRYR